MHVCVFSVFAGCQIPYPKREFLSEDEPEEKTEKVTMADLKTFSHTFFSHLKTFSHTASSSGLFFRCLFFRCDL